MKENKNQVIYVTYSAVIAALYVVLTLPFASFVFGPIQFRVAEALTILPFFTPAAIPGLTIGCFLANLLGGAMTGGVVLPDVVFGTLATFIGAVLSYALRKNRRLVCVPPIVSNTLIIPWILKFAYGMPDAVPYMMLTVGVSEVIAIGGLGNLLMGILLPLKARLFEKCPA